MTAAVTGTLADAYAECDRITRAEARNFSYGIRLLPPERRAALSAVYALARRIDDIGDGDLPQQDKLDQLEAVRAALSAGGGDDPVMTAVHDAARRFPVPLAAFGELVDGVEMDVVGTRFETFDQLVAYCRCVAGSVGRLCLGVFGARELPVASRYADALGIALQQTNVLRDIREDLLGGRVYLPQEELDRHGVSLRLAADGSLDDAGGELAGLVRSCARRAAGWYDEGLRLLPLLDRRSAACTAAMAGIYRRLNDRIEAQPSLVLDRRVALSSWQKTVVAARALAGRAA